MVTAMDGAGGTMRDATAEDAVHLAEIYRYYITDTVITFEIDEVASEVMNERVARVQDSGRPWIVLEVDGEIQGFAYAAPFRERTAYRHSVETSVYLARDAVGRGHGTTLYEELLARLRDTDVHVAIALIALPNEASVALHERLGFWHAGTLSDVGRKFDRWIDVGYWQLAFD
jgi:phosphinothricin acetyltransferase